MTGFGPALSAHLSDFGVFGLPERRLIFDINDFDETPPGPSSAVTSGSLLLTGAR